MLQARRCTASPAAVAVACLALACACCGTVVAVALHVPRADTVPCLLSVAVSALVFATVATVHCARASL